LVINADVNKLILGTKDNGEPFRVMIVDDSAFMVKTIKKLLEGFGCEIIDSANNGEEAIAKFQQIKDKIDLITLDISMPKKDGLTTLPQLVQINPGVKVVMVSAMGDKDKVKQAIMSGAKHFIVKPFKAEKVYDIFKWVVEK
jgi:two-component system, chemotaxis family, chemotaxis protein CheY